MFGGAAAITYAGGAVVVGMEKVYYYASYQTLREVIPFFMAATDTWNRSAGNPAVSYSKNGKFILLEVLPSSIEYIKENTNSNNETRLENIWR